MAEQTPAEKPEQWDQVGAQLFTGFLEAWLKSDISKAIVAIVSDVLGGLLATGVTLVSPLGIGLARSIAQAEDLVAPALSEMAAVAVSDMFGVKVSAAAFERGIKGGGRSTASTALSAGLIQQLTGPAGDLQPSDAAAKRFLDVVVNMALEGWYQKWFFEFMTSLIPQVDIGKIENFGSLDDKMSQALGIGRLTRRVLSPLIDTAIVEPLRWQTNKKYTPNLLSAAEAVRQLVRGRWSREQVFEELARQGWSHERIEALINAQRKMFSAGDVRTFVDRGHWTREQGLQHLQDQGYDQATAEDALRLEGLRRIDQLEAQEASSLVTAYANREIDRAEFQGLLANAVRVDHERAFFTELAELRRGINVRQLSAAQVEKAVRAGILAMPDYRAALRREGYAEDGVIVLELLLRSELEREARIEDLRAKAQEERAAEQQARADAAAKRRAEVEAERALRRRGPIGDLERAAVRGLIPVARLEESLAAEYDADTVAILVNLVDDDRQRYLAQQERAEEARQRAAQRELNIGELERAVLANILTIPEYRQRLSFQNLEPADIDVLASTLEARKRDLDAAKAKRDAAGETAKARAIDLGRFEQLVRRGVRTLTQYTALLEELGFDDAAIAAMRELLELKIADDQAAAGARLLVEETLAPKGLSVDQFRRSVVLGLKTANEFDTFLTAQGVSADVHTLLAAELHDDLARADAARQRRAQTGAFAGSRAIPLASVARAARLGLVSPDTYRERLELAGYTFDDVAIEMDLLVAELGDVQQTRQRRDAVERELAPKGVSLADTARAVRAGVRHLEDYRAQAIGLGYGADDVDTLTRVLADELRETTAARVRRTEIDSALKARDVSLAVLEEAVRAGTQTIDAYRATLEQLGFAREDGELLAALLDDELAAATPG